MELTEDKIKKNASKYFKSGEVYGFLNEQLVTFLGTDFIGAPASTATNLHNAFEGGLVSHLLLTTKYAVALNEQLPESMQVDKKSLVKVCCLHQIGKSKLYKPTTEDWKMKKGIMYDFNDQLTSMHVGERSAYYALSNGVELTEEEYQAIINHDKDDSDKQAKWHTNMLGVLLKQANELAILEEKNNG
jgi:flagellar assembly factor FliW